jgi:hypothetical protein
VFIQKVWLADAVFLIIFVTDGSPAFSVLSDCIPAAAKLSFRISCSSWLLLIRTIIAVVIASIVAVTITSCLVLVFLFFIAIVFFLIWY